MHIYFHKPSLVLFTKGTNNSYHVCNVYTLPPKVWKHPWQSVVLDDISINPYFPYFLVQIH